MRTVPVNDNSSHLFRYLSAVLFEWLLLGASMAGLYRRREFFELAFTTRAWSLVRSLRLGIAVYLAGFLTIGLVGGALYFTPLFHRRNQAVILALMPRTPSELAAWLFVSLTAGLCEELIFRGYLLQQLSAWTKRPVAAIVLTGVLFGCLHLYEGVAAVFPLAALGILYGFVVRRSHGDLRAVILAHTLQDFLVAFIPLARPFLERYNPHA